MGMGCAGGYGFWDRFRQVEESRGLSIVIIQIATLDGRRMTVTVILCRRRWRDCGWAREVGIPWTLPITLRRSPLSPDLRPQFRDQDPRVGGHPSHPPPAHRGRLPDRPRAVRGHPGSAPVLPASPADVPRYP